MRRDDDDLYEKPNVVIMPDKDTGGLYIGCLYIAGALADRETYGHIGAIVRIGVEPYPGYPSLLPDVQYHCINKHRKQGISVYVHCAAGVRAFRKLKLCRPVIDPNNGC